MQTAFISKLVKQAQEENKLITSEALIKEAILAGHSLDDAVRLMRNEFDAGNVPFELLDHAVILLTHPQETKEFIDQELQQRYEQKVAEVKAQSLAAYEKVAHKAPSEEVKQEAQKVAEQIAGQNLQHPYANNPLKQSMTPYR